MLECVGRDLNPLINKSVFILREVKARFKNPAVLWSSGKDSTCTIYMAKFQAFGGQLDWPVIHIDTGLKFPQMYEFRDRITKLWNLNLVIAKTESDKQPENHMECCYERKTLALKNLFQKEHYDAIIVSIRWDEHPIRGMERYFSPRDHMWHWNLVREKTPEETKEGDAPYVSLTDTELAGWNIYATDFGPETSHVRVHPILHWTEVEMWCVPGDTVITSENGSETMESIIHSNSGVAMSHLGFATISHKCITDTVVLAEIESETGRKVSVTPGNPVMTNRGWLVPKDIKDGDELLVLSNEADEFGSNPETDKLEKRLEPGRGGTIETILASGSLGAAQGETSIEKFESYEMESQISRSKAIGRNEILSKICANSSNRNRGGVPCWNNRWRRNNILAPNKEGFNLILSQREQHLPPSIGIFVTENEDALFTCQNERKKPFWTEKDCWIDDEQYSENQGHSSSHSTLFNHQKETCRNSNGIYQSKDWKRMLCALEREANRTVHHNNKIKFTPERATKIRWKFGLQRVYDLTTSAEAFFANSILIHNSYMQRENMPFNPLYLSNGETRYRSLGCTPCTKPVMSKASTIAEVIEELNISKIAERAGRLNTKEGNMARLRYLGYM